MKGEKMSKLRKWIFVLCAITIMLIIVLIILNKNKIALEIDEVGEDIEFKENRTPAKVSSRNDYYAVKKCVNKFYTYYSLIYTNLNEYYGREFSDEEIVEVQESNKIVMYNMLDKKYVESNGITEKNIDTILPDIGNVIINVTDMYVSEIGINFNAYIVKGVLRDTKTNKGTEFQILVKVDRLSEAFAISIENVTNIENGYTLSIEEENIEQNRNNKYNYQIITDEAYVESLASSYQEQLLYNQSLAYNFLDEEYGNKKFESFEEFQEYINNNSERYSTMQIEKYQKKVNDNYTQYVCIDKNGNYYIFNETAPFVYSVILDTYTIDLPEFLEKYNSATEQQKVALNIDKFISAINDKDYKYAYNCLADSFKSNYFKTQEDFENYAKETFYSESSVAYNEFDIEGDLFTYAVTITDKDTGNQMKKTFIMQLGEGTKFQLSFDV